MYIHVQTPVHNLLVMVVVMTRQTSKAVIMMEGTAAIHRPVWTIAFNACAKAASLVCLAEEKVFTWTAKT